MGPKYAEMCGLWSQFMCSAVPSGGEVGNSPSRRGQKQGESKWEVRMEATGVVAVGVKKRGCILKVEPG